MTTFNLPDLGEGLPEAEIVTWHVQEGDEIKVDELLVSVETAKAVVEVPSPHTGVITKLHARAGDIVETGKPLVEFRLAGEAETPAEPAAQSPAVAADSGTVVGSMPTSDEVLVEQAVAGGTPRPRSSRVKAAPAVRALAKKLGVDLGAVDGSGKAGLVTVADVKAHASAGPAPSPRRAAQPESRPTAPPPVVGQTEPLRGTRRAMARSMSLARDQISPCTLFDDADIQGWIYPGDITVRLLRALVAGCRAGPGLNAQYDGAAMSRRIEERIDVAIAVDTPEGLIVPVVRGVHHKSDAELREDVNAIKTATRNRTVAPADMRDFTITLSNFGTMAGRYATPLVVPPTVAILGTGVLQHDVVAVMGGIEVHRRIPLSLTFDHRVVTGGEACRFLGAVIADLERPE